MNRIDLSNDDAMRLASLSTDEHNMLIELGAIRLREHELVQQVADLRNERTAFVRRLGKQYLDGNAGSWEFRPELNAFVSEQGE